MSGNVHLIMPMAGSGSRFKNKGFEYPKPLIEIQSNPFFYWATRSIEKYVSLCDIIFVVLQEHINKYNIDEVIKRYYPDAIIHIIPKVLNGAVLTCLEAVKEVEDNKPIIFNDCDHMFKSNEFNKFCSRGEFSTIDAALLTFKSNEDKYGYVQLNKDRKVCATAEKIAISEYAICGAYYFKNAEIFVRAAQDYLRMCDYQEFYMSAVYNVMVSEKNSIVIFDTDYHLPFGIPEEYEKAKESERFNELL